MALMDVYRVICIPMAAFYFFTVYLLLGKRNLSKVFKHTNFDLLRFGMLMLFYIFVGTAFFIAIMFLTTEAALKQQFLVPAFMGIGVLIIVCDIFTQIAKRSTHETLQTIRDITVPLIWGITSFAYMQTVFYLVGLEK